MRSFQSLALSLSLLAPLATAQIGGVCEPIISLPNTIATTYPNDVTGTLNGTAIIVPISYKLARSIIPSEYPILKKQYKQWLPNLPDNQYPALLQMELVHDLLSKGVSAGADYVRAGVSFPFVDRLKDGYTAMTYGQEMLVSKKAKGAIKGFKKYGYAVSPAYYAVCNGYEYENATSNLALPPKERGIDQAGWEESNTDLGNPDIAYRMLPVTSSPYSVNFFYNVTNQPRFSNNTSLCDMTVRLYNTDVSLNKYAPIYQQGNASALSPFFGPAAKTIWTNVYGLKLDVSFYETPDVACSTLKGFHVIDAPS